MVYGEVHEAKNNKHSFSGRYSCGKLWEAVVSWVTASGSHITHDASVVLADPWAPRSWAVAAESEPPAQGSSSHGCRLEAIHSSWGPKNTQSIFPADVPDKQYMIWVFLKP